MTDGKKKDGGESVLEFFWDSLELAVGQTYSTTLRIKLTGWWEGVKPKQVGVSVYERGQEPPAGDAVRIQKGFGIHPLTGLLPGHHYLVVVFIDDRLPVQKMITVPELPKPKRPEEDALELEQIELKRAQVFSERRKLEVQEKKPTEDEKKTDELRAKVKLVEAEKELKEAIEGKLKVPKDVLVSVSGAPGKQKFLISIAAEDGTFIPNQSFTIVDGDRVVSRKTDEKGIATYEVDFTGPSRCIEVRVGNTKDLVWQEQVSGPAEPNRPEFRKALAPADYSQMGREAARRHFRKSQPVS